jgi:hypothetical protein
LKPSGFITSLQRLLGPHHEGEHLVAFLVAEFRDVAHFPVRHHEDVAGIVGIAVQDKVVILAPVQDVNFVIGTAGQVLERILVAIFALLGRGHVVHPPV